MQVVNFVMQLGATRTWNHNVDTWRDMEWQSYTTLFANIQYANVCVSSMTWTVVVHQSVYKLGVKLYTRWVHSIVSRVGLLPSFRKRRVQTGRRASIVPRIYLWVLLFWAWRVRLFHWVPSKINDQTSKLPIEARVEHVTQAWLLALGARFGDPNLRKWLNRISQFGISSYWLDRCRLCTTICVRLLRSVGFHYYVDDLAGRQIA